MQRIQRFLVGICTLALSGALGACGAVQQGQHMIATAESAAVTVTAPTAAAGPTTGAAAAAGGAGSTTPTQEVFRRMLESALPRMVRYAGVEFSLSEAQITNEYLPLGMAGDTPEPKLVDDHAVARLTLELRNGNDKATPELEGEDFVLELAGKRYSAYDLPIGTWAQLGPGSDASLALQFRVPSEATWENPTLIIGPQSHVQAMLPLLGDMPEPRYPATLAVQGSATAGEQQYELLEANLDLDHNGERAKQNQQFLTLKLRITNNGSGAGGVAILRESFRLLVGGSSLTPLEGENELLNAKATTELSYLFAIPADATQVELEVGESAEAKATITLDLSAASAASGSAAQPTTPAATAATTAPAPATGDVETQAMIALVQKQFPDTQVKVDCVGLDGTWARAIYAKADDPFNVKAAYMKLENGTWIIAVAGDDVNDATLSKAGIPTQGECRTE